MAKSWTVGSVTGGRFPALEPLFFTNKAQVAIPTALTIKIYQLNTKQVTAKIPLDCSTVTQIILSKDESSVFVVHENGSVELVGLSGDSRPETIPLAKKIIKIVSVDEKNNILALYQTSEGIALGSVHANSAREFFQTSKSDCFCVSNNGEYLAVSHASHIDTFHMSSKTTTKIARARPTASIAISNKGLVAVGSPSGVIDIYYAEGLRSLKWHLEPVRALHFSLGDNYLISGGEERVLVFWQMDADKQQFLPRLDGAITSVSSNANSTLYAVTLDNAQTLLLGAVDLVSRLAVSGVRTRFAKLPSSPEKEKKRRRKHPQEPLSDYSTIYRVHPGTRNAYFVVAQKNGLAGSQVQVYNPIKDEQEATINIASTIPAGKVRSEQQISDPSITHLEFSSDGKWMVTVDVAPLSAVDALESRHDTVCTLKFWSFANNSWTLAAKVEAPHGAPVAALKAHPRKPQFVTCARDGELKLWRYDTTWGLRRTLKGTGLSTRSVALGWSEDGSVLAVGHDQTVLLVDGERLSVSHKLQNLVGSRVRGVAFSGKHLAILAKTRLVVWDLVLAQQAWSIATQSAPCGGRLMASAAGHLALAVNYHDTGYRVNSRLLLWDMASPIPVAAVNHPSAVSALEAHGSGFSFVDTRGLISSLGGALKPPAVVVKQQDKVALYNSYQETEEMVDEEQTTKRLGINSFDNVYDDGASLETLFDRVMRVVG